MAEYVNSSVQTVASNGNVVYSSTAVSGNRSIQHREGSGIVTLRGLTNGQSNARFLVMFGGNIAIPTGGTVQEISLAIAISGEAINSSYMRVTPAAVANYFNVSGSLYVTVPSGCCVTIAVENTSGEAILVDDANLIVTRVS